MLWAITRLLLTVFLLLAMRGVLHAQDAAFEGKSLQEWMKQFQSGSFGEQRRAGEALTRLGPKAKPAAKELIQIASSHYCYRTRTEAQTVVILIGDDALPHLIDALRDKSPHQYNVVWAVCHYGGKAKAAAPRLIEILHDQDRDPSERQAAARALGNIGHESKAGAAALIESLKDKNVMIRHEAVAGLARFAKEAKAVAPALAAVLRDSSTAVKLRAAEALAEFGPEAKPALPDLTNRLDDETENPEVREAAAEALGRIGPAAKDAVPALCKAARERQLRFAAARALGRIGADARAAVPVLIEVYKRNQGGDEIIEALKKIDPNARVR